MLENMLRLSSICIGLASLSYGCASIDIRANIDRVTAIAPAFGSQLLAHRECLLRHGITKDDIKAGKVNSSFKSELVLDPDNPKVREFIVSLDSTADFTKAKIVDQCRAEANSAAVAELKSRINALMSNKSDPASLREFSYYADGQLYPEVLGSFSDKSGLSRGTLGRANAK